MPQLRPLMWNHERDPGLIWKWPPAGTGDRGDLKPAKEETSMISGIAVREYESAIILKEGRLYAEVASGRDYIIREPFVGRTEVIFVDLRQFKTRWGVGGIIARDGLTIGAHGVVYLRVSKPSTFIINVVAGNERYTTKEVEDWISETVRGIMRSELARYEVLELTTKREEFITLARVKLDELFSQWGLEFLSLEIEGFQVPQEYLEALKGPTIARKLSETSAIESKAEAERRRVLGMADTEILESLVRAGIDPVQLKAVEALIKYAETPSQSGGPIPADLYKPNVFLNLMEVLRTSGIPQEVRDSIMSRIPEEMRAQMERVPAPERRNGTAPDVDVDDFLMRLDMRLVNGEISEETYREIKSRWERQRGSPPAE